VFVTSRGDPEEKREYDVLYNNLNEWLQVVGMALLASSIEFVHQYGTWNEKDTALKDADLLARAKSMGASLV